MNPARRPCGEVIFARCPNESLDNGRCSDHQPDKLARAPVCSCALRIAKWIRATEPESALAQAIERGDWR